MNGNGRGKSAALVMGYVLTSCIAVPGMCLRRRKGSPLLRKMCLTDLSNVCDTSASLVSPAKIIAIRERLAAAWRNLPSPLAPPDRENEHDVGVT